jgi:hypothetical protein
MKLTIISIAALLASTALANAETFTFTGKNVPGKQIAAPGPAGKPIVAAQSTGDTELTWASGKKQSAKNECMAWSAPPGSGFSVAGVCSSTSSDGSKLAIAFSCVSLNDKNTMSDCWGKITGMSGPQQGKTSTVSWRGTQNPDGNGGTVVGAGVQH